MFYIVGLKENKYFLLYTFLGNSEINLPFFFFFYFSSSTFTMTSSNTLSVNERQKNRISRRLTVDTQEPYISIRPVIKSI